MAFERDRLLFYFVICTGVVLFVGVNCELSTELDYADNGNSTEYGEYDEESTVERLKHEPNPVDKIHKHPSFKSGLGKENHSHRRPNMMPLYDKDGKRLTSSEVYADLQRRNIKNMYYDADGKRVTVPVLLREEDIREANLTSILQWIEWLDSMRGTLVEMKEKATGCKPHNYEELSGYESVSVMLKDIQEALKTVDECENKLHKQLRDPEKKWNYPSEKEPDAG